VSRDLVTLDGSAGEGGGQILRTALTLSLLTGRPFRLDNVRARRSRPGLQPQHLAAVRAAADLCGATLRGAAVGSMRLDFDPGPVDPSDRSLDIGTAGSTALVLQTISLPLALRAAGPLRAALVGGTFNEHAPSYPFLQQTWAAHLGAMGLDIALGMPAAGFYPQGGGRLEAWIEPGRPRSLTLTSRGPLTALRVLAGTLNLERNRVAERLRDRAVARLQALGHEPEAELQAWSGRGQGAAIALTAEFAPAGAEPATRATFVGLGRPGKPAEAVADETVDELLAFLDATAAIDEHSADQLLLPLALAEGASRYTTPRATEHLRTNVRTIRAFLDRRIRVDEADGHAPALVSVD
jgi:RNA 3'-terminal phosphate cyclase (ATP)